MKNRFAIPVLALIMLGTAALAVPATLAQVNAGDYPPIVQKLAEKFGLNEDEVASVFEENREEHYAQMQAKFTERLDEAVASDQITTEQKELILQKQEELRAFRQENHDAAMEMSPEERHEFHENHRNELKIWANENGIDLDVFGHAHGGNYRKGFRSSYGFGSK
ncbi:hypothetical protein ACFL2C_03720 [Patescibacteria group bacterium]